MIYTITVTREDGLKQDYMIDEAQIRGARIGIAGIQTEKMIHGMLDVPEIKGEFLPLHNSSPKHRPRTDYFGVGLPPLNEKPEWPLPKRYSTLQPGQKLEPLNPDDNSAAQWIKDRALEIYNKHNRDALLYGTQFPQQVMGTWEDKPDE